MFAEIRTDKVKGRIKLLINSTANRKVDKKIGHPSGTKWDKNPYKFFEVITKINLIQILILKIKITPN